MLSCLLFVLFTPLTSFIVLLCVLTKLIKRRYDDDDDDDVTVNAVSIERFQTGVVSR